MEALSTSQDTLAARWDAVRQAIAQAAQQSGRAAQSVRLIAVSKTHPANSLAALHALGAVDFGENRIQEAESKIAALGRAAYRWHLIGPLQANKARKAVALFDMFHALDNAALALRLDRICAETGRAEFPVLLQANLSGEATKSGTDNAAALTALRDVVADCKHLQLRGLMTLPPYFDNPDDVRPYFCQLRELRDDWQTQGYFGATLGELSMGMSHDFAVAIAEGATLVRVGTALFGTRSEKGVI